VNKKTNFTTETHLRAALSERMCTWKQHALDRNCILTCTTQQRMPGHLHGPHSGV